MHNGPILDVQGLTKSYPSGSGRLTVLKNITFSIERGLTCSIVGPSGSGKTTLLGLCAGLDEPTSGSIKINGQALELMDEDRRASLRNELVGFVFQNFQLIPTLTALEHVMVPRELRGQNSAKNLAMELLTQVDLANRSDHYPSQLSGGEQQRVALARAFVNEPKILFADEPTGNLDEENSHKIVEMLFALNRKAGTTLVLVTHNLELARSTERIIQLKGGSMVANP